MRQLLDEASNQNDDVFLEMAEMIKEDYETVSLLCDTIESLC